MRPMTPAIALDNLEVEFGARTILHDLTLSVSGRAIGLLGPNGAGKTTLIHTLLGFHRPSAGTAHVMGLEVCGQAMQIRRIVGYMPERDSFIAGMTAVQFVRLMAELSGLPRDSALERTHEVLFYVGIGEERYRRLETYSFGMRQLVKLAQAIVHSPELIILDEPTNGLDPPARARMLELILNIRDGGQARILLSSHLLRDVEQCCDTIVVLKEGQLAACFDLETEQRVNRRLLEVETGGDVTEFAEAIGRLGCEYALSGSNQIRLVLGGGVQIQDLYRVAAEQRVQIRRLGHRRDSLEALFLEAVEDE